ncbi:hypothetical protein [Acinetobacter pittii]|uniref:Uncharacterized protein n=1 Tax=Acinetobacter pittii TaxID=48296 RepID=A0A3R9QEG6_ACIPI|nr:hypothetical protein [Acinetobacter pittii]HEM6651492.1 hypothetical protein [Acinetobacter baumannii]KQE11487.1 hypothetical protein APD36_17470 [Acinetobacter pittii]KRI47703.1 hypothetical protein APC42_10125 [Acinetobacter pittii]RSO51576.1 hypothetical protein EA758_14835 [Acinetobacter pittii]RSO57844.1 hypothetical protein EA752_14590 [Acinetobacter pittii]
MHKKPKTQQLLNKRQALINTALIGKFAVVRSKYSNSIIVPKLLKIMEIDRGFYSCTDVENGKSILIAPERLIGTIDSAEQMKQLKNLNNKFQHLQRKTKADLFDLKTQLMDCVKTGDAA